MRMFPHHARVTRPSAVASAGTGQQNSDGVWEPGSGTPSILTTVVVFDGPVDVQDNGATVTRDAVTGVPVERADARMFLRDRSKISRIHNEDTVRITWTDGTTQDAEVAAVIRLDATVLLRFV